MTRQEVLLGRLTSIRALIKRECSAVDFKRPMEFLVEVVAVTKAASDEDVLALSSFDIPLAENRWEQLSSRISLVRESGGKPLFHFIGALQRRSTKEKGVPVSLISTVDRESILPVLDNLALANGICQSILVEVDLSGISGRSGVSPESLPSLLEAISRTKSLDLKGLLVMGVPASPEGDLSDTRKIFERGREIYDWLGGQWAGIETLSMGMSGDFREAVRAGSTQVRLGTILFGKEEIIGDGFGC